MAASMIWQEVGVALLIAGAAFYLARQAYRSWRGYSSGGCSGCGCGKASAEKADRAIISTEQLVNRLRNRS
jgi:hypothetical protein